MPCLLSISIYGVKCTVNALDKKKKGKGGKAKAKAAAGGGGSSLVDDVGEIFDINLYNV